MEHTALTSEEQGPEKHSGRRTLAVVGLAFFASCFLTGWVQFGEVPSYSGFLQAEVTRLEAPFDARVESWLVDEGQEVRQGDPIMTLADPGLGARIEQLNAELKEAHAELEQAVARADVELSWRLRSLDSEILRTRIESAGYLKEQFNYELKNKAYDDWDDVPGYFSDSDPNQVVKPLVYRTNARSQTRFQAMLDQQEAVNASEVVGVQIEMCDKRIKHLESLKAELPLNVRRANGVDLAERKVERLEAEVERLSRQEQELRIVSVGFGTASTREVSVGDHVRKGDLLMELYDEHQLSIAVEVPSHEAPAFVEGAVVKLVFPGNEVREGSVLGSSHRAYRHEEEVAGQSESVVRIRIQPRGQLWPVVPIGSSVKVAIDPTAGH